MCIYVITIILHNQELRNAETQAKPFQHTVSSHIVYISHTVLWWKVSQEHQNITLNTRPICHQESLPHNRRRFFHRGYIIVVPIDSFSNLGFWNGKFKKQIFAHHCHQWLCLIKENRCPWQQMFTKVRAVFWSLIKDIRGDIQQLHQFWLVVWQGTGEHRAMHYLCPMLISIHQQSTINGTLKASSWWPKAILQQIINRPISFLLSSLNLVH